jgi:Xaa-Pro aminopeptidase
VSVKPLVTRKFRLTPLDLRNSVRLVERVDRLREEMQRAGCDATVAVGPLHAAHLAGYDRYLSDLGGFVAVVVAADGSRTLVVPRPEVPAAEADTTADAVLGHGPGDVLELDLTASLVAACAGVAGRGHLATAGTPALVTALVSACERTTAFDDVLARLRRRKDPDELARIAASVALAMTAQAIVSNGAEAGRTEIALFGAAQAAAQEAAGRPVGWIATVASGARSALISPPFCVPGPDRAAPGEPVLADIAVRHRGYWGDTTRTYGGGDEVAELRAGLEAVREEAAAAARPGVAAAELFARMREAVEDRFVGSALPHHGGHGLGVEIGEPPQILPGETGRLEEGMVIALEPGAYRPGRFGVRVERTYRVGADGARPVEELAA